MRRTRLILEALALGLLTTLILAWLLPLSLLRFQWLHVVKSPDTFWTDGLRGGHYEVQHHPLLDWVYFRRIIFTGGAESQPYFNRNPPPAWASVISLDQREGFEEVWTGATGWPWRAFRVEEWHRWPRPTPPTQPLLTLDPATGQLVPAKPPAPLPLSEQRGGIDLYTSAYARVILPYFPVWPGLGADLLLWSLAWCVGLAGARFARRAVRRRRGRCVFCAYDRRGLDPAAGCPECGRAGGTPRPQTSATIAPYEDPRVPGP